MLAPNLNEGDKVILFDGVCKLCAAWAQFLIKYDRDRVFKLSMVQSPEGQEILKFYGMSTEEFETMALVEGKNLYVQSSAFLRVMNQLPYPWPIFGMFKLIPTRVRDWMYDRIALNRYRLFGKYDSCLIPHPDHDSRFVLAKK